ncbi:MAG: MarR family transcriptional regulator [Alphaproteobacteria bacterium]|nr:MarR family transcriptional regulator [Alphaproteobacteria bacterium]
MDHVDEIIKQWAAERPDLDTKPMALLGRLLKLQQHTSKAMADNFSQYGLNTSSFDVLATLRRSGPPYQLSPGALINMTMVTSGTMTNRIDQLVKAGFVERIKNPDDGRGFLIALTEKGFKLVDDAVTTHVVTQKELTDRLSDEDRNTLNALVKKYLATFENEA